MAQSQTGIVKGEASLRRPASGAELSSSLPKDISSKIKAHIQKIQQRGDAKWDKDELLDVIYWARQILGPVAGLLWGILPVTGLFGVALFIMANIALTISFYKTWLMLDEEDYGGHNELVLEGLGPSISFFVVTWVLTYTAVYS